LKISGYLTKPVRRAELRSAITAALAGPSLEINQVIGTHRARGHSLEEMSTGSTARILLTEDNVINQRVARRMIEKAGHTVVIAGNGREALDWLSREEFDIVLMDVQMPEMDGLEATAAIRKRERGTGVHIPIIAMTAHAMKGDEERCLASGMDGYLAKPIRAPLLLDLLKKFSQLPVATRSS
jgi:two-component system sensor histidine kinase/response regulator